MAPSDGRTSITQAWGCPPLFCRQVSAVLCSFSPALPDEALFARREERERNVVVVAGDRTDPEVDRPASE
jgi:hypothetical protein